MWPACPNRSCQGSGAVIALLRIRQRRVVLVEIGLLQIVVDGIELRTGLDLVALAHVEFGDAAGFIGADEDHVGLDPALKTGILAFVAARERGDQRQRGHDRHYARRKVLSSPFAKNQIEMNLKHLDRASGACLLNRLCQITAINAGATRI